MDPGGPTSAEAIRATTASALRVADELGARSLGLVAFGTGVGGFSVAEAARIEGRRSAAISTATAASSESSSVFAAPKPGRVQAELADPPDSG